MRFVHLAFVLIAVLSGTVAAQANFECYAPGRFPLPGPPNCEGLLCNNLGLSGLTGIQATANCGMPTVGNQYARIEAFGPFSVPPGGPVTYPLPNNVTQLRIPIPSGATSISLCWDFFNAESFGSTSFNDGMAIAVLDSIGTLVQSLVYADVNTLPGSCFDFIGFGGVEVGQTGPQGFTAALNPFPPGSYLSVICWNGGDNAVAGNAVIDDVNFGGIPSCPPPPPPPINDDCTSALNVIVGSNGPFSNVSATNSLVTASCGFGFDLADIWFVFTPTCSAAFDIDTCGAPFNTVLSVYDMCVGGTELACNDDDFTGACPSFTDSKLQLNAVAGTSYFIRVAGNASFGGVTGSFNLNIGTQMSFQFITAGPGTVGYIVNGAPPGGLVFVPITLNAGNFPNGIFFGIDISLSELVTEFSFGYPFAAPADPCGTSAFGPVGGVPSGVTLFGTALGFPGPTFGIPTSFAVMPASVTVP